MTRPAGAPDQVDPEQHAGLLQEFGLEPQDLIGKLGGVPGLEPLGRSPLSARRPGFFTSWPRA